MYGNLFLESFAERTSKPFNPFGHPEKPRYKECFHFGKSGVFKAPELIARNEASRRRQISGPKGFGFASLLDKVNAYVPGFYYDPPDR